MTEITENTFHNRSQRYAVGIWMRQVSKFRFSHFGCEWPSAAHWLSPVLFYRSLFPFPCTYKWKIMYGYTNVKIHSPLRSTWCHKMDLTITLSVNSPSWLQLGFGRKSRPWAEEAAADRRWRDSTHKRCWWVHGGATGQSMWFQVPLARSYSIPARAAGSRRGSRARCQRHRTRLSWSLRCRPLRTAAQWCSVHKRGLTATPGIQYLKWRQTSTLTIKKSRSCVNTFSIQFNLICVIPDVLMVTVLLSESDPFVATVDAWIYGNNLSFVPRNSIKVWNWADKDGKIVTWSHHPVPSNWILINVWFTVRNSWS